VQRSAPVTLRQDRGGQAAPTLPQRLPRALFKVTVTAAAPQLVPHKAPPQHHACQCKAVTHIRAIMGAAGSENSQQTRTPAGLSAATVRRCAAPPIRRLGPAASPVRRARCEFQYRQWTEDWCLSSIVGCCQARLAPSRSQAQRRARGQESRKSRGPQQRHLRNEHWFWQPLRCLHVQ